MKKIKITQSVNWQKVMRISLMQFIALFLMGSFCYAHPSNAQTILDKEVTVKMDNVSLKEAIQNLQGQTQVKFVYSSRIKLKDKVSLNAEKAKLSLVLDKLLTPSKIGYKVINEQIVLVLEKAAAKDVEQPSHGSVKEAETEQVPVFTVSGTVSDEKGERIPGVSIAVKGTTIGTITDISGEFSLAVNDAKATLLVSSIGFLAQELAIGGKTTLNIVLEADEKTLGEVVVVGYGDAKKANLTGAVSSVKMSEVDGLPISNAATALQGRMAGVTISSFTGQPGKNDPVIRIRGIGSFNANGPLVVIDGVPNDVGSLGDLSVDDIESVSVLKDAASASIYGVRAANGVILVTTKRGAVGKPKIQYRATYSTQTPLIKPDYMGGIEWANAYNDFLVETGAAPAFTPEMIQKLKDGSDPNNFKVTDWFDEVYKPAPLNMQFLSASGGTEATKYLVSLEYLDQKGIMDNTNSNRLQMRLNLDTKISKHLSFGVNLRGIKQNINEPIASANQNDEGDNGINRVISGFTRPTMGARYTFGEFSVFDGSGLAQIKNPIKLLYEQKNNTNSYRLDGKAFGRVNLLDGLSFTSSLAVVYNSTLNYTFAPSVFTYLPDGTTTNSVPGTSNARNAITTATQYVVENLLRYEKVFNKNHDIKVLLGQTAQRNASNSLSGSVRNLPSNDVVQLSTSAEFPTVGGGASASALQSFLGRINYAFNDKYLVEVNARVDGSSRLPASQQYPLFPSASAGWVMSNERFFKNNIKFIEFLKLRASWGQLGNQDLGTNYPFVQNYSLGQNYFFNNALVQGAAINGLANDNIKWEKTAQTNFGIDLELPNRWLRIEADYFDKNTTDILVTLPIPATLGGLGAPNQNAGSVSNKGFELLVNHSHKIGKFQYDISLNGSMITNTITSTAGREGWISGATINQVGSPVNSFYGYASEGLFRSQEEVGSSKQFGLVPRAGDIKYTDVNKDGDVTVLDRMIIGNPFPKFTYGANIGFKFAGFDFTTFFQGVSGITRYYADDASMNARAQKLRVWNNRWTTANPTGNLPRWGNPSNNNNYSTFRMQDASYVRLKNLEVGYNVPKSLLKRVHMTNLRVYFNGVNLWTMADNKDYDVEKSDGDQRTLDYMNTKSYSFGLSATF